MLTRVIALRLQTILNKIINKNQTGFLKGWYIEDNLRVIRDALHILRCSNSAGFLVALDFSKAFDSLGLEFIYMVLRWYGFSPNFLSPVELISADIELCLIDAGLSSRYFKPARGIRQGCCVSPYLFIMAVEMMATCIRNRSDIVGIPLGGGNSMLKITQFADDSTCFLSSESSLIRLLTLLQKFARWSGLTINKKKSMILFPDKDAAMSSHLCGIPVVQKAKILGIWFFTVNSEANQ